MTSSSSKKWPIVVALAIFAFLIMALFFVSPEEIVDTLGVENTYLIAFLLAAVGGISTVTGASVFLTIAAFASGGADPWLLGLIAGLGIFISDSVFYILAKKGSDMFETKVGRLRHRLESFVRKASLWRQSLHTLENFSCLWCSEGAEYQHFRIVRSGIINRMATPDEHSEILRLLRENNDLSLKNNKLLRTLYRHSVIGFTTRIIWFVILIGLPFALYFTILEPYFDAFGSNYDTFRAGIGELPGLKGLEQMMLYFEHGTGTSGGQ